MTEARKRCPKYKSSVHHVSNQSLPLGGSSSVGKKNKISGYQRRHTHKYEAAGDTGSNLKLLTRINVDLERLYFILAVMTPGCAW